jgi:hypothetical protein
MTSYETICLNQLVERLGGPSSRLSAAVKVLTDDSYKPFISVIARAAGMSSCNVTGSRDAILVRGNQDQVDCARRYLRKALASLSFLPQPLTKKCLNERTILFVAPWAFKTIFDQQSESIMKLQADTSTYIVFNHPTLSIEPRQANIYGRPRDRMGVLLRKLIRLI